MNPREMSAQSRAVDEALEKGQDLVVAQDRNYIVIRRQTMADMEENVRQVNAVLGQMAQLMASMQRRMDDMEARQEKITVRHADVKRIQQLIRIRTAEICGKYALNAESARVIRAAIKKDVLKRWGVKDLHDLPAAAKDAVENAIGGWVNIRLVMERRGQA